MPGAPCRARMTEYAFTLKGAGLVAAGAVVGALARWAVTGALDRAGYAAGTTVVNALGSFLIGLLLFSPFMTGTLAPHARLLLATGILGAFTTMSSFAFETLVLLEDAGWARAALNVLLNPGLALAACWLGRVVALAIPDSA